MPDAHHRFYVLLLYGLDAVTGVRPTRLAVCNRSRRSYALTQVEHTRRRRQTSHVPPPQRPDRQLPGRVCTRTLSHAHDPLTLGTTAVASRAHASPASWLPLILVRCHHVWLNQAIHANHVTCNREHSELVTHTNHGDRGHAASINITSQSLCLSQFQRVKHRPLAGARPPHPREHVAN